MSKNNTLWRLDLLEVHYLNTQPRYSRTKLLLKSKKKPANLLPNNRSQALKEIDSLKSDIFNKKLHSSIVKYKRTLKKIIKAKKNNNDDAETKFVKNLNLDTVTNIKIIKLIQSIFKIIPKKIINESDNKLPYIPDWVYSGLTDKENPINQSHFYNSLTQDEKNYYSKIMNNKELLQIVKIIENSFRIVLGPVENKEKKDIEDIVTSESESESGSESEDDESQDEDDSATNEVENDEKVDINDDEYSQYDALVAGSEDEDEEVELDTTVNYNEVTDTEPSDEEQEEMDDDSEDDSEDDFFEAEPKKEESRKKEKKEKEKKKDKELNLPELAAGYYSGASDSEPDDDQVVKKALKPQKKNRRGQRARQKIWEAKFKNNANHIKKEKETQFKERQQRQKEYEERVAKRAAKAKELEITGSNNVPLKERTFAKGVPAPSAVGTRTEPEGEQKLHPSWEAKKKQEEALKNVKFEGKKIKF